MPEKTEQRADGQAAQRAQASKPFDPRAYLRRIVVQGRETDYLDVKWRLVWLRNEHPDAHVTTELVSHENHTAVFRAEVVLPSGGRASGYGSETRSDFPDYIEKAETKAIGRALVALGFGTQFALDFELPSDDAANEMEHPAKVAPTPPPQRSPETTRVRVVAPPEPERHPEPEVPEFTDEIVDQRPTNLRPIREEAATAEREAFEPADYSWTEFWKWARGLGYTSRSGLADLLGLNLGEMTPQEVRRQLIAYRQSQGIDE